MRTQLQGSLHNVVIFGVWLATVSIGITGCGPSDLPEAPNPSELLETYHRDRRHHDPVNFAEVDLGDFTVTQRHEPAIFYIRFHLYGVVPEELVEPFEQLRTTHHERVRDAVRQAAQRCDIDHLNDPCLGWLKSEMISSINRLIQSPILRDVVFADFSFERG